jgi:hypothetical protein
MIKSVSAKRSIKAICVILAILLMAAFILVPGPGAAAADGDPVISGHISLPDGDTAGEGGLTVTVAAMVSPLEGAQEQGENFDMEVVIPEGQSTAEYSLSVPKPEQGFGYTVSYTYRAPDDSPSLYADMAWYCDELPGGATRVPPTATVLDVNGAGDFDGIDIILVKYRSVSGVIVLPDGMTAPSGGLKVNVSVFYGKELELDAIGKNPNVATADFTVPAGESSCEFRFDKLLPVTNYVTKELSIDLDEDNTAYRLIYQISGGTGYKGIGFYGDAATVESYDGAAKISLLDSSVSGLIFPLISEQGEQATPDTEEIAVYVNGKALEFDVPPVIIDDRTLVPFRVIFEALGLEVGWDEPTRTVTGTKGDMTIKLVIDSTEAWVNDEPVQLDTPPIIVNDRTLVPVRFISESLGADVAWAADWRTVVISGS